ncbi:hypothetical protein J2Z21_007195 [Streptomyces griseochromogenes]|uniref:Uncharacterized protein n=1 Tax=Streptomyces griseochromogenes TaxID=68214 RepID=A0ABS4M3E2_9ACTN|nr:hypothetical protein [Streptomyces griseochromogenes]
MKESQTLCISHHTCMQPEVNVSARAGNWPGLRPVVGWA